jgi:hypothetical protein
VNPLDVKYSTFDAGWFPRPQMLKKVLHANFFSDKAYISSANPKVSLAMQNKQLSEQRPDDESRREYKSPTLRKLGKLTHMTLAVMGNSPTGDGMPNEKTS